MKGHWKGVRRKRAWPSPRYELIICMDTLKKRQDFTVTSDPAEIRTERLSNTSQIPIVGTCSTTTRQTHQTSYRMCILGPLLPGVKQPDA